MRGQVFLLLLSMAGICGDLHAQAAFFSFGHLTTDQGLSQDLVRAIAQDTAGYLWFGTNDGLTRFDGRQCMVFRHNPADENSLPDNRITGLSTDKNGVLWVATFKGICLLEPGSHRFRRLRIPAPTNPAVVQEQYFSNIAFDPRGMAWAVTDSFLVEIQPETGQTAYYKIPCDGRPAHEIEVFADSKGRIWVTFLGRHLLRFDRQKKSFTYVRGVDRPNGDPHPWPMSVREDSRGTIWNADWDQAFYTYDETRQQFVNLPDSGGIATVFLLEERSNAPPVIWAGGGGHGLWRLDCAGMQRLNFSNNARDPYTHNNTRIHALYRDPHTGILWIGTEAGVEYYDPNSILFGRVLLPEEPGNGSYFRVSRMVQDPAIPGRFWISLFGVGLFEWQRERGVFHLYNTQTSGFRTNDFHDLIADTRGNLWIASWCGLEQFDPRTRRRRRYLAQPPPLNTPEDQVLSLTRGPDNRFWAGNNRGKLLEIHPDREQIRVIDLPDTDGHPLPPYSVWNVYADRRGRILVSSPNGLLRYDPATGAFSRLLHRPAPLPVRDAVEGNDGRLYAATREGVYVLDASDSLLRIINVKDGLYSQQIQELEADHNGDIWIATARGLHRFDPQTGQLDGFNKADGLFAGDIAQGLRVLPTRELFVSGEFAFNIAPVDRIRPGSAPPRLALNQVDILNRTPAWAPGETIVLQPGESFVTFDISVIHFTQPEQTVLSYRLEGFDDQWIETTQHNISFTNLDGGAYTLLVRARNGDGVWSRETLRIPFRVVPPFYRTWWFRLLAAGLLLSVATAVYYYRRNARLRLEAVQARAEALEKQQLLNEIALLKSQVNPHFLFNSLSILSSLVHVDADLSEQFIDQLSRSYRYILEQKDQSLVSLRTEIDFIRSYSFLLKIRFEDKFSLNIQIPETAADHYSIAPLTLQLLVENAVKHNRMSAAEPLRVDIRLEAADSLAVSNHLQRRPAPASASTGIGLQNILNRYALITDRAVEAGEVDGNFVVRIPLMKGDSSELS